MKSDFLTSCCRVCLLQEEVMIYIYDIVEEYNKTLCSLLESCGDLKIDSTDNYSKLICEDCTKELMIAAKFREKCQAAKQTLSEFLSKKTHSDLKSTDKAVFIDATDSNIVEDTHLIESILPEAHQKSTYPIKNELIDTDTDVNEIPYEEVEYLDTNIIEVYSMDGLATPKTEADGQAAESDFILDEIIEENDEETLSNFASEDDMPQMKKGYEVILAEDTENLTNDGFPRVKSVHGATKVVINHTCDSCGAGFTHLNNLQRHMQLTHQENDTAFVCTECSATFLDRDIFNRHLSSHANTMKQTRAAEKPKLIVSNVKKCTNECKYCGKLFASKSLLNTHERVHTGERPYKCSFCDKKFTTQGGLDLHTRRHEGRKPFLCTYCNKRFVESSNLKVHLRIHTGEKPHRCNRCDRSFSRVFLLQIHQRTHTGERPYSCPICKKAFAQQGDLAAHKRIHTGERPHICPICKKGFIKSSGLTSHMRRHKKCDAKTPINNDDDGVETEDNHPIESVILDDRYDDEEKSYSETEINLFDENENDHNQMED